ncbi:MAG: preprotein translocase subunit SecE [Sodaliphilus pleomorphus]|jgi:preprotein translocase subunit SecE|uniref:Protein translocase subunit SecE n=1 Tax=Sodaliphilus pleomorphus TaxID=2606626 RepID=A0A6L5XFZ8_9BACT|nr:preprotein translocase subunit SecE [Sodaliphilus pleomorphus]MCI5980032.1 preprotein translocase subunit SecE [Muribaculaceae bacterium]MDY6251961.1 preprotein translocase subunit SecE [Bacteroidales bacterium]MCI6168933.1 preprotein translocase subunit SecE [Muribaculaceae bacterium]MDD6474020.1 preprotein translocase subunit SecE [Sodaliphilus pleomorphus]MDD6686581.1 preprotein translocase subunit SecE [Sodaliphilus pleomorphus]
MAKAKILTDLEESYNELVHKVSWPSKTDLANSTVIVMVASILMALVIWAVDAIISWGMENIIYRV